MREIDYTINWKFRIQAMQSIIKISMSLGDEGMTRDGGKGGANSPLDGIFKFDYYIATCHVNMGVMANTLPVSSPANCPRDALPHKAFTKYMQTPTFEHV